MKFVAAKEFVRPFVALALLAAAVASTGEVSAQTPPPQCTPTGSSQTCQNSILLSGATGVSDNATLTLTNTSTGTISGTGLGVTGATVKVQGNDGTIEGGSIAVNGNVVTVTNSKTIQTTTAGFGTAIKGDTSATVTNHSTGTIFGFDAAIDTSSITLTNDGTITGSKIGIIGSGSITNSGTITGSKIGIIGSGLITNSGTISGGTGGGNGAVVFTGGAGATNTLTLQSGSKLTGDVVGSTQGATNKLVLQGSGSADSNFLNFNSLDVQAGGNGWTLNGNASAGTATLENNLIVGTAGKTGATLTGDVTVNSGGALLGDGQVAGNIDVMSGGRLAPGNGGSSTFKATGRITFEKNSTFDVSTFPSGRNSMLSAGSVTIKGGAVNVLANSGAGNNNYAPSTKYTIVTATGAGGVQGAFDSVTSDLAFLKPTLTSDTTNVFLTLALINGTGESLGFVSAAQTRNQAAVASALDAAPTSNSLVGKLLTLSADGARAAFNALSGEVFGSVHNTQAQEGSFTRSGVLGRLRQASYSDAPGELGALGFAGPELAYADGHAPSASGNAGAAAGGRTAYANDGRLAYAADANGGVPVKAPHGGYNNGRDLTFWAQGLGGWGHSDSDGNAASLKSRFGGFLSGADMRFGQAWRAGLVAGYTRSDLKADARASSAGIDSVTVGLYAGGRLGAFNLRTGASFSYDSIDASRSVIFPTFADSTRAHFHGQVGQVFGEVGYSMGLGTFAIEPFAGLAYVHLHDGSFLESGGIAALAGSSAREDIGYSSLGIRAATFLPLGNGTVLVPRASAQWQHAFGDVTPTSALAFQSTGTAFTVAGIPIARDSALVETGLDWRISPWTKLGAFYQGELAAHAQSHAIKGGFTLDF